MTALTISGIGPTINDSTGLLATDGVTELLASGAELNRVCDSSTRIVATTATTLTVTAAVHGNKVVVVNSTAPLAVTLPQATGSGELYRFIVGVAATATAHTIKVANATDVMAGCSFVVTTTATNVEGFATSATSDTITFNGTTTGGIVGDKVEIMDIATGVFNVRITGSATGTEATPFSATV
jgi:hypothetical protein